MIRKKNTDGNVLFWWVFVYRVDAFIIIWVKHANFFSLIYNDWSQAGKQAIGKVIHYSVIYIVFA